MPSWFVYVERSVLWGGMGCKSTCQLRSYVECLALFICWAYCLCWRAGNEKKWLTLYFYMLKVLFCSAEVVNLKSEKCWTTQHASFFHVLNVLFCKVGGRKISNDSTCQFFFVFYCFVAKVEGLRGWWISKMTQGDNCFHLFNVAFCRGRVGSVLELNGSIAKCSTCGRAIPSGWQKRKKSNKLPISTSAEKM